MNRVCTFLLVFSFPFSLHAQTAGIDSLTIQRQIDSLFNKPFSKDLYLTHQHIARKSSGINYKKGVALANLWMGNYSIEKGELEDAVIHYQELVSIGEELKDSTLLSKGFLSLAIANSELLELDKSIELFQSTIKISKQKKDSTLLATALNGLGIVHAKKEDYDNAVKYLTQAKELMAELNINGGVQNANYNISYIYLLQKKALLAIPFAVEYLDFSKSLRDSFGIAAGYSLMGKTYRVLKNYDKALIYNDSALTLIDKLELNGLRYEVFLEKSETYEGKKDFKTAYEFYQKFHSANEKFINEETKKNIAELEVKFDTERKEKELLASQKEVNELEQTAQIRKQRLWMIGLGLIASLLISLLIYFKSKSDAAKKEIEEKLIRSELINKELEANQLKSQLKNKEADLTNLALDIGRKNAFSNELINQLEKLKKVKPEEIKSQLREVSSFAINHLQINEDLALLQNNVDKVNQEFYKKLEEKFGQLTANEKYLAGLIRLNLSNKDVAAIRGISTSSAKMSRHRLRKKIGLNSEEDIVVFLQKI